MEMESRSLAQGHRPLPVKSCPIRFQYRCCEANESDASISTLLPEHLPPVCHEGNPKRERLVAYARTYTSHHTCTCQCEPTGCTPDDQLPSHAPSLSPSPHHLLTTVRKSENETDICPALRVSSCDVRIHMRRQTMGTDCG